MFYKIHLLHPLIIIPPLLNRLENDKRQKRRIFCKNTSVFVKEC